MGRDAIEPDSRWVVGDGQHIRIRQDTWLPFGKLYGPANRNEPRMVADLIDQEAREWDVKKVNNLFEEEIATEILTKSGYNRIHNKDATPNPNTPSSSCQIPKALWHEIWHIQTFPKIRFFLWNLCTNTLPTNKILYRRQMLNNPTCQVCRQASESAEHLFTLCASRADQHSKALFMGALWQIWKCRNRVVFQGR